MWSLLYLFMRTLVAFIIGTRKRGRDEHAKDLEILVLRHQLRVLQRTAGDHSSGSSTGFCSWRRAGLSHGTAGSPSS
jgi:hypothetical protein